MFSPNKRDIKEMKIGLGFDISDIYIGRYFSNFVLSLTGSGPGLGPSFGFFFF